MNFGTKKEVKPDQGISTLVNHAEEGGNPFFAHISPIYQTSIFRFPDVETGAATVQGQPGSYYYTRLNNPNLEQLAAKISLLEALDLWQQQPEKSPEELAGGLVFSSGMAAITSTLLSRLHAGDTIIAQEAVYSNTFTFLHNMAPQMGIQVVWLKETAPEKWEAAFAAHPNASLAYAETPANPTMLVVDLQQIAEISHRYGAWLMVDNTFATPFCQRPLTLGADIVVHSTTKYISGHGAIIGGAVITRRLDFLNDQLKVALKSFGGSASPFDAWLINMGLRTFELRMRAHCENAMQVAHFLEKHPKVARVYYPGLPGDPGHALASRQMHGYGGMLAFELKGGLRAGEILMNSVSLATLAVSLGTADTLIQHPASMTHAHVPPAERLEMGLSDGLVRFSVGIENIQDILADLEAGLSKI